MDPRDLEQSNRYNHVVREKLIQSIYALVHNSDEWPNTLYLLNGMIQLLDREQDDINLRAVQPHIKCASLLLAEIEGLKLSSQQNEQIIDSVPMAIILMQSDGLIITSNKLACSLLSQIDVHTDRFLRFKIKADQFAFSNSIRLVATTGHSQGESLRIGNLNLWICSFDRSTNKLSVFLSDHSTRRHICTDTLQTTYNLTIQESRVVCELCNSLGSLEEAASLLAISIHTARTHLKKVFAKTGAHNQAELMKMVMLNPFLTILKENSSDKPESDEQVYLTHLPSGRTISWAEYGDPTGIPVLFCHPITGCRLLVSEITNNLNSHGIRLIVPDRAGYGYSSPTTNNVMDQWLEDMRYFFKELCLESCEIVGHSVGGAYAMELAAAFPNKVRGLHLIGSIAPFNKTNDSKELLPINRMLLHLSRTNPEVMRAFLNFAMKKVISNPESYFKMVMKSLPDSDQLTLETNGLKERLIQDFEESHRQGVAHYSIEMLYLFNHWDINPENITCPTTIWHGLADRHSPASIMQRFKQRIPNCSEGYWLNDLGFYMVFSHWNDIAEHIGSAKNT